MRMLLSKSQILSIQLLISRGVYNLRIKLFLVMLFCMNTSPIYNFAAAFRQAYAMNIKRIQLWSFFRHNSSYGNFSDLKLIFFISNLVLRLFLSILLLEFIISLIKHFSTQNRSHILDSLIFQQIQVDSRFFANKINNFMNSLKKRQELKKPRYEIAVQSEPVTNLQAFQEQEYRNQSQQLRSDAELNIAKNNSRPDKMARLVQELHQTEEKSRQALQNKQKIVPRMGHSVNLNLMKLKDKSFDIDKNIYNITIGDISSKEIYLANLNEEIRLLKNKIRSLQDDQIERTISKTIVLNDGDQQDKNTVYSERPAEERSRTIENVRKSQCGRIYSRLNTPASQRKPFKLNRVNEDSTYFKWRPQIDDNPMSELPIASKQMQQTDKYKRRNPEEQKGRSLSNYRVKQRVMKQPFGTEQNIKATPSIRNATNLSQTKQNQKQKSISVKQFQGQIQIPEEQAKPVQFQNIVVFKQEVAEWQITSINDDFRVKIMAKLQIPKEFPIQTPSSMSTVQQYQHLSQHIYSIFGVNLDKMKQKVIVRKFKNGVYFQLPPDKNIVWYFNSVFYFGNWETELPSQGQKNGFGFQYVPDKYIYLGHFKDGARHGRGVIKVFPTNKEQPELFMAYDGEWINGKPDGFGKHIDEKNTKYIGNFQAGQKTGNAVILNKDGLFYQGQVKKGLKDGKGHQKLVNGDEYLGDFTDGKFNGKGVYKWSNKSVYEGDFVMGKRQGRGLWKSVSGDSFEGEYLNDAKHGWGKFTWANGQIYQGQFRNDIRHGEGTYKHPGGKVGKFLWKDGKIEHRIYSQQQQEYRCRNMKEKQEQIE